MELSQERDASAASQTHASRRWGHVGLLIGSTALLLLLAIGLYLGFGSTAVPEPFDVESVLSISVPDDENAMVLYREAAPEFVDALMFAPPTTTPVQRDEYELTIDPSSIASLKLSDADVERWLAVNRAAMETWKLGSQRENALETAPSEYRSLSIDDLLARRASSSFTRLALVKADRLTRQGKAREAWEWHRAALRTSRHFAMHSDIIARLVSAWLYAEASQVVISWSARPELTATDLREVLAETLAIDAMTPRVSECLKVEYISAVKSFDENLEQWKLGGRLFKAFGARERAHRSLRLIFANWLSQVDRPLFRRAELRPGEPELFEVDSSPASGHGSAAKLQSELNLSSWRPDLELLRNLVPKLSLVTSIDREQVRRSALLLSLALELYAREHGQLPSDLETLVQAEYLKTVPPDPFGKGEPFHYRRAANPLEGGLLWSVWTDRVDQEGKIRPQMADDPGDMCFDIRIPTLNKSIRRESGDPASVRSNGRSTR
jgi:hypothetical protein